MGAKGPVAREAHAGFGRVYVEGETELVGRLEACLRQALGERGSVYHVDLYAVGRCGEVMLRITGMRGELPLLFHPEELEPGYVRTVVSRTVDKFAF
jgi:hypothetical protein